jgi:hypothetical protein
MTACVVHGALYFLPLYIVTMVVGLSWEVLFAIVRRVEVNEGFFVTGILFPLILPPTTPLWQAALGISFGVVLATEVFGGTGMNFVNPALAARRSSSSRTRPTSGRPGMDAATGRASTAFGATLLAQMRQMTDPSPTNLSDGAFIGLEPAPWARLPFACLIGAPCHHHRHRLVADDGRRDAGHDRDGKPAQHRRFGDQPVVRRAVLVAHGRRGLGVRHRVHGHRSGDPSAVARAWDLRRAHWRLIVLVRVVNLPILNR